MKIGTYLLAACLILAVAQAGLTVLTYLIIGSIVIGLITRPSETLGTLIGIVVLSIICHHPLPGALLILAICIVAAIPKVGSPRPAPVQTAT
ncbi:hypothetical protein [uncultured Novosphingobium sp.]|uniref:hypothetical protein n=1 Tax=uncultured Novosphingobium sp. TaxID=292277 RepID=UPI0025977790|nr:hypothetical protein [uncultured Novosphingobium sp.]